MWTLETDWYEIVIRAIAVFGFLFLVFRFWGKKHFGEFTPFDFIILLIMSEAVQNALVDDDKGIPAAVISITTMMLMNILLNKLSFKYKKAEDILEGTPKVLIKDGKLDRNLMKQETITERELHEALRMQGVWKVDDVFLGMLEANGSISVIKKKDESFFRKMFH